MINNYIGSGITFPIQLDVNGAPVISTGFTLVNSSIKLILGWTLRSRIFLSSFGSILDSLLEEPNDDLLKGMAEYFIYQSLNTWEKRIEIIEVNVRRNEPEKLDIEIHYKLRATGLEEILVYPYYTSITT